MMTRDELAEDADKSYKRALFAEQQWALFEAAYREAQERIAALEWQPIETFHPGEDEMVWAVVAGEKHGKPWVGEALWAFDRWVVNWGSNYDDLGNPCAWMIVPTHWRPHLTHPQPPADAQEGGS